MARFIGFRAQFRDILDRHCHNIDGHPNHSLSR